MSLLDNKKTFSPSEVNFWLNSPGLCILNRFLMEKSLGSASMIRGNAVESGMKALLYGRLKELALGVAMTEYWANLQGVLNPETEKEAKLIPGMIDQCAEWKKVAPGPLLGTQLKVEYRMDGLVAPFIGYLDFSFDSTDTDLKTTSKLPNHGKPKRDHARQVALYRAARNKKGGLLYVTDKKHLYCDLSDQEAEVSLKELHEGALSLQRFLAKFNDPIEALKVLPIDRDSFRWSSEAGVKLEELRL